MITYHKRNTPEGDRFDNTITNEIGIYEGHMLYAQMMSAVDAGEAEIIDAPIPEPTSQDLKLEGVDFEGTMCSATSEDMWGLASIKDWIKAGQSTTFEFSNGNKLTLDSNNIDAFEAVWIPFRASFF